MLIMPARKMRVEVFDGSGSRYTVTLEGHITREKALRVLEIVELLGGIPTNTSSEWVPVAQLSKIERVRMVVEKNFPIVWFSSRDVQIAYEQEFKEPINLSVVSTYLSRMSDRGFLMKKRVSNGHHYRIATLTSQRILSVVKDK